MIPAVDRSFRILDLLSRASSPLGTSEVARRLRLPKSSVHGLLSSLEVVGAVERVRLGFRLGPAVERLAAVTELRRRWRAALEELVEATGETAFLGQLRGSRVAILDEVLGRGGPVVSAPVGSHLPAGAGALRAVLAGARAAEDRGAYLPGVNAAAAAVPGGLIWTAGFASRFGEERLPEVVSLLERLTCG